MHRSRQSSSCICYLRNIFHSAAIGVRLKSQVWVRSGLVRARLVVLADFWHGAEAWSAQRLLALIPLLHLIQILSTVAKSDLHASKCSNASVSPEDWVVAEYFGRLLIGAVDWHLLLLAILQRS